MRSIRSNEVNKHSRSSRLFVSPELSNIDLDSCDDIDFDIWSGWLGGRDSNPDSQIQSLESYHWTTSQRCNRIYGSLIRKSTTHLGQHTLTIIITSRK